MGSLGEVERVVCGLSGAGWSVGALSDVEGVIVGVECQEVVRSCVGRLRSGRSGWDGKGVERVVCRLRR